MNGVNKAFIIGTLGADPELRHTTAGTAAVTLSVATSEKWKDKNTGEQKESTEWHRIVLWGKVAEVAAQYLQKGSKAYFEGKLQTRKWQDRDGNDRYTTEINAYSMQMLGDRQQQRPEPTRDEAPPGAPAGDMDFDDDIPF